MAVAVQPVVNFIAALAAPYWTRCPRVDGPRAYWHIQLSLVDYFGFTSKQKQTLLGSGAQATGPSGRLRVGC